MSLRPVIVDVSRSHHGNCEAISQAGQSPVPCPVSPDGVLLKLHEEVPGTEGIQETSQKGFSGGLAILEGGPEGAPVASGEEEKPLGPPRLQEGGEGEKGVPSVGGLHVGLGQEAAEVGVSLGGLGQEGEVEADVRGDGLDTRPAVCRMIPRPFSFVRRTIPLSIHVGRPPPLQPRYRGGIDAHLGPGNGLEPFLLGGTGELHGAVEAVVVRQGEGRISQLLRPENQLLRVGGAIQEGEARVGVELDVGRDGHRT